MFRMALITCVLVWGVTQQAFCFQPARKLSNQEMAEKIATALSDAELGGGDILITFQAGVATLEGFVADSAQKQKAGEVTSRIPGVKEIINSLRVARKGRDGSTHAGSEKSQSLPKQGDDSHLKSTNQEIAESIADALSDSGFRGYDIKITFQGGVATLEGNVADPKQKKRAREVVSRISGVEKIVNSLQVSEDENQLAFGVVYAGNSIPQPVTEDLEHPSDRSHDKSTEDDSMAFSYISPMSQARLGKQLMARQQELFESETLHKIEVSRLHKDKSAPLYDIYCGRKQLVVVSRCGGSHSASFEGRLLNDFQGGVYEWKSGEKAGTQYKCEEQDLLQLFRYDTDVGGFMTGLYMQTQTQPELFKKPVERENGVKEFRLKTPYYNFLAIAVSEDPLWLCELTTLNADGEEVKRVYSQPVEVDQIPESITRELQAVKFEPTLRTIHSLMIYP